MSQHFYCLLPGLLPESKISFDEPYPNLATLLSKAESRNKTVYSLEGQIIDFFQLPSPQLPAGALSAYYHDALPAVSEQNFCQVSPIHTRLDAHTAFCIETLTESLAADEVLQLQSEFNKLLDDGHSLVCEKDAWFFPLSKMPDISVNPIWEVLGKSLHCRLPSGPDAAHFQRLMTECEMLLKSLKCHTQRLADQQPTLDSLWFWGLGPLPYFVQSQFQHVISNETCVKGLAKYANCQYSDLPNTPKLQSAVDNTLLLDTSLLRLMAKGDIMGWFKQIKAYDEGWIAFLLEGLQAGRIAKVTLDLGRESIYTLTKKNLNYFWRRKKPLEYFV